LETLDMDHKNKKKGITPLMITLLLISFAVAVGFVVMNFGAAAAEDQAICPIEVGLKLAVIGGQDQLCYNQASKEIAFTLENGINIKVDGLVFNAIGNKKAESFELTEAKMIKAGNYMGNVPYDASVDGELQQIKITPVVVLYEESEICTEQALILENIRTC